MIKGNILKIGILLLLISCSEDDAGCGLSVNTSGVDQTQLQADINIIDDFLAENNITAIEHESGLRYVINNPGAGSRPNICNDVLVNYDGRLLSNNIRFDANDTIPFSLGNLILGWQIGFGLIEKGTSATLYVPSGFGYGTSGFGNDIPPNANLIFDVDLIDFR